MLENIINTCKRVARALHMLVIIVTSKVYFVIFFLHGNYIPYLVVQSYIYRHLFLSFLVVDVD